MKAMMGRETTTDFSTYVSEFVHPDDRARMAAVGRYVLEHGKLGGRGASHRAARRRRALDDVERRRRERGRPRGAHPRVQHRHHRSPRAGRADAPRAEAGSDRQPDRGRSRTTSTTCWRRSCRALELMAPVAPESLRDVVTEATHAARRAAELVSELMTFAGQRRTSSRRPEPIGALVERAVGICRSTFDRRITLDVRVPAAPLLVDVRRRRDRAGAGQPDAQRARRRCAACTIAARASPSRSARSSPARQRRRRGPAMIVRSAWPTTASA